MKLNKTAITEEALNIPQFAAIRKDLRSAPFQPSDRMVPEGDWSHQASILENISEAVIFTDRNFKILTWNKAAESIYGWKEEDVINRNVFTIIQPESLDFKLKEVMVKLKKDGHWKRELNNKHKDGRLIHVLSTVYLAYDPSGKPYGAFTIIHDITHQKLAEKALQQNEKRFRTLVQNSSDVIVVLKPGGVRSYTSPSVERIFGRSQTDFLSKDILSYVHPDDLAIAQEAFSQIMQVPDFPVQAEFRFEHANRSWLYIDCVVSNYLDEPGVEGIVVNMRDITKTKLAEQMLEKGEARLRALMQHSSDIICILRMDGTIGYISPSVEHILGYSTIELMNKNAFKNIHPHDLIIAKEQFKESLDKPGSTTNIEFRIKHNTTGDWVYLDCAGSNQANNPSIEGLIVNIRDITDRKRAELRLNQVLEELEKRNHELDNYVYKVSHDLRAPLCSIMGLSGLIKTEEDTTTIKQYNTLIETSVNKLDNFIQSVLHHSKTLNKEVNISRINFKKIVNDCFEELKYLPNSGKINIKVSVNKEADFYSDEFRIAVLFKNFISNSIKYLNYTVEHNYIHFTISITKAAAEIIIEDNGIGIDKKYVEKIFDMFFRATNTSNGSGLGLYIVRQTVQKLGGTISVESKPSKGTTFKLNLPNLK